MANMLKFVVAIIWCLTGGVAVASDAQGGKPVAENIVEYATGDVAMERAMQQARSTLSRFFELSQSGLKGDYLVKMRLSDGVHAEHIWVSVTAGNGELLEGYLANDPTVPGYLIGDVVTLRIDDIEDWMVNTGEVRFGGYTVRAMLKDLSPEQISEMNLIFRD